MGQKGNAGCILVEVAKKERIMINNNNDYNRNVSSKCVICAKSIFLDSYSNGRCDNCGWYHSEDDGHMADRVIYPNLVSFAKAKQLSKQNKPFTPTFEEFIQGFEMYGEMEFHYNGKRFGLARNQEDLIVLHEWNDFSGGQRFATTAEFHASANIAGRLLKDIWHEIENPNFTQS